MIVCVTLASGATGVVLTNPWAASGATTSSTTTANAFLLTTDKSSYVGNATIVVSGVDPSANGGIAIAITNPKNLAVASQNVGVTQNGSFSATFLARWPVWNESGVYRVTAIAPIADFVGNQPTSYAYFNYTAVPPASTGTSTTATSPNGAHDDGASSIEGILGVVAVIVIAVAVVGLMLRSRGRVTPRTRAPAATQPPKDRGP